jgi:hypothetical protein
MVRCCLLWRRFGCIRTDRSVILFIRTELHQYCRVHITSSSLSFFRSQVLPLLLERSMHGRN